MRILNPLVLNSMASTNRSTQGPLNLQKVFIAFSGFVLFLTAVAKLVTSLRPIPRLFLADPVFPFLNLEQILEVAAFAELASVLLIVLSSNDRLRLIAIVWLNVLFLVYRLGLLLSHAPKSSCPCLGALGEKIGLSDQALSRLMLLISTVMLAGASWNILKSQFVPRR